MSLLPYLFPHVNLSVMSYSVCQMHLSHRPHTQSWHLRILTVFTTQYDEFAVLCIDTKIKFAPSTIVVTVTVQGSSILTQSHSHDESLRDSTGGRCRARNDQCGEGDRRSNNGVWRDARLPRPTARNVRQAGVTSDKKRTGESMFWSKYEKHWESDAGWDHNTLIIILKLESFGALRSSVCVLLPWDYHLSLLLPEHWRTIHVHICCVFGTHARTHSVKAMLNKRTSVNRSIGNYRTIPI